MNHAAHPAIHATAVVIGEAGVLIRGVSGAGKSELAHALIAEAARRGLFGRLVGDDRIVLRLAGGRVSARPHPRIAGLMERRGIGVARVAHEPAAIVKLVVDLDAGPARMPDETEQTTVLEGVILPRFHLAMGQAVPEQASRVVDRIRTI